VGLSHFGSFGQRADSIKSDSDTVILTRKDSLELRYGMKLYGNPEELSDSIFKSLKTKKFEDLKQYIVNVKVLKDEFDTLDLTYLNRLATVKSEYAMRTVQKQHIKFLRECKAYHYNPRTMMGLDRKIRVKQHSDGHEIAEVLWFCKSGKHKFYIGFLQMKVMGHWFLADELVVKSF